MASPARRGQHPAPNPPARPNPADAGSGREVGTSGLRNTDLVDARQLQDALEIRYRRPTGPDRWSRRRTIAFVVIASGALWALVIAAAIWGVRLITG